MAPPPVSPNNGVVVRPNPWLTLAALVAGMWIAGCDAGVEPVACPEGICQRTTAPPARSAPPGDCVPAWRCTPWQTESGDEATRTCTDGNRCETTAGKPAESATLPALDFNYYQCVVEPIFDKKCSMLACHGNEGDRALRIYARGRLRLGDPECQGSLSRCGNTPHSDREWRRNYDSARGFMLDAAGQPLSSEDAPRSDLIAQPVVGGKAHRGMKMFASGDDDHTKLLAWLRGAKLDSCETDN